MPFRVSVDPVRQWIQIALEGFVTKDDLVALSRAVREQPCLAAGCDVLYDCTAMTDTNISSDLVRTLAMGARRDSNRVAFIARTPVAIGLARMYQILSEGEERMRLFSDEKAAREWLESPGA